MADAITPAFATAALVLGVAGFAKLRSHSSSLWVLVASGEIALSGWCLLAPGRIASGALACAFAAFSVVALVLARRGASCGCFGEAAREEPASVTQSLLSAALASVALAATLSPAHGLGWVLARPAGSAAVLVVGICASAYAAVLAYTQLPRLWSSW
jgi:hypothetical protein